MVMIGAEKVKTVGRRIVCVPVSFDLLREMAIKGARIRAIEVVEGVPPDSEFIGSTFSESELVVYLFFGHPSFERVPPGEIVPRLLVTHKVLGQT
jgi:hypothetical protein